MAHTVPSPGNLTTLDVSYSDHQNYPENLVQKTTPLASLKSIRHRLDDIEYDLFNQDPYEIKVPFRDIDARGHVYKQNVYEDDEVDQWIRGRHSIVTNATELENLAEAGDSEPREPRCRFIFLQSDHSWKGLNITRTMLCRIFTYHQVHPAFLDFVMVFGSQERPRDFRFSGFKAQKSFSTPRPGVAMPDLGRSGQHFQLSYNLKCVAPTSESESGPKQVSPWARRQCAVHHQFDMVHGTSLWITASAYDTLKRAVEDLLPSDDPPLEVGFQTVEACLRTSLLVHLLHCQWSMEHWRWYLQWLEEAVDTLTDPAIESESYEFTAQELQQLQSYEDRINEAVMIMETNMAVMESLLSFYTEIGTNRKFGWTHNCQDDVSQFNSQLKEMVYDLKMHISRGSVLVKIGLDRKALVQHHIQDRATKKMELLTEKMRVVSEQGRREAVIMRIITFITLIYLPATFVSTFFSTDVVKYQNTEAGTESSFSRIALERWLQVAIPLTAVTVGGATILIWRTDRTANLGVTTPPTPFRGDR